MCRAAARPPFPPDASNSSVVRRAAKAVALRCIRETTIDPMAVNSCVVAQLRLASPAPSSRPFQPTDRERGSEQFSCIIAPYQATTTCIKLALWEMEKNAFNWIFDHKSMLDFLFEKWK